MSFRDRITERLAELTKARNMTELSRLALPRAVSRDWHALRTRWARASTTGRLDPDDAEALARALEIDPGEIYALR